MIITAIIMVIIAAICVVIRRIENVWGRMTMERRMFIKMAAGAGLLGLVFGVSKGRASPRLRPPGAEHEEAFLAKCARCGKCAEVCPLSCIQIADAEDGIMSINSNATVSRYSF